jgi:hypothetical protein
VSVFAELVGRGLLSMLGWGRGGRRGAGSARFGASEEAFERGILGLEMGVWLVLAGE